MRAPFDRDKITTAIREHGLRGDSASSAARKQLAEELGLSESQIKNIVDYELKKIRKQYRYQHARGADRQHEYRTAKKQKTGFDAFLIEKARDFEELRKKDPNANFVNQKYGTQWSFLPENVRQNYEDKAKLLFHAAEVNSKPQQQDKAAIIDKFEHAMGLLQDAGLVGFAYVYDPSFNTGGWLVNGKSAQTIVNDIKSIQGINPDVQFPYLQGQKSISDDVLALERAKLTKRLLGAVNAQLRSMSLPVLRALPDTFCLQDLTGENIAEIRKSIIPDKMTLTEIADVNKYLEKIN